MHGGKNYFLTGKESTHLSTMQHCVEFRSQEEPITVMWQTDDGRIWDDEGVQVQDVTF